MINQNLETAIKMINNEEWRPACGFLGYLVSNLGRVKSLSRLTTDRKGKKLFIPEKMMTWTLNQGYPRVTLRIDGRTKYVMCHKLVASTFIGKSTLGQELRHKNGDKGNPSLDNIEYGTRSQNIPDAKSHGTFSMREKC